MCIVTHKEFYKKIKKLQEKFHMDKDKLAAKCALSNSIVQVGDIIEGTSEKLTVEIIDTNWVSISEMPTCTYRGPKLTAAGKPWATGKITYLHQLNVEKINGEPIK